MILIIITVSAFIYNYYCKKYSNIEEEELIEMKPIEITY